MPAVEWSVLRGAACVIGLAIAIAALSPTTTASADGLPECSKTWLGGSGAWGEGAQWTPGGPPNESDDVCIDEPGDYTVEINGEAVANSLRVGSADNTGARLLLNGAMLLVLDPDQPVTNHGTIEDEADGIQPPFIEARGGIDNRGLIAVHHELAVTSLLNAAGGTIRLYEAKLYIVDEAMPFENFGTVESRRGGSAEPAFIDTRGGFLNSGLIDLRQQLAVGALENRRSGRIQIDLAPEDTKLPPLYVGGSLKLAGTISLSFGDYDPIHGDVIPLIRPSEAPTRLDASVEFDPTSVDGPQRSGALSFVGEYVVVTLAISEPQPAETGSLGAADDRGVDPLAQAALLALVVVGALGARAVTTRGVRVPGE